MTAPEFPRPIRLDAIGEADRAWTVEADEAERAALARRFGLVAIDRLAGRAALRRDGAVVFAAGEIDAEVTQSCVASGADVAQRVTTPFALRFVPEGEAADETSDPGEIELDEQALDELGYAGAAIDLGEAVAQTLALALDPFPRAPGADAALRAAGVIGEEEAGPFAALRKLLDR